MKTAGYATVVLLVAGPVAALVYVWFPGSDTDRELFAQADAAVAADSTTAVASPSPATADAQGHSAGSTKAGGDSSSAKATATAPEKPSDRAHQGSSKRSPSKMVEAQIAAMEAKEDAIFLPKHERTYLWTVEQRAFEFERHVLRKLAQAIENHDRALWKSLLHPNFGAKLPPVVVEKSFDSEFIRVDNWAGGPDAREVSRSDFLDALFALREPYTKVARIKFGVPRLQPVERGALEGPWVATVRLEIRGEVDGSSRGETILYADLRLARLTLESRSDKGWLERFDVTRLTNSVGPQPLLVDVAKERGLDPERFHDNWRPGAKNKVVTGGVFLNDYNQDDWLDVFITDLTGNALFRGGPDGKFVDVTYEAGLSEMGAGGSALFADLDGDGDEDLITGQGKFRFYRNQGDGTFKLIVQSSPMVISAVSVADYDNDGQVDIYLLGPAPMPFGSTSKAKSSSWIGDKTGLKNLLIHNLGNWQFEVVSKKTKTDGFGGSGFATAWLDVNNDGHPDMVTANELGENLYCLNQGDGTFRRLKLEGENPPGFSMGVSAGDYNNDGLVDLYIANMYSKAGSRVIGNVDASYYPEGDFDKMRGWVVGNALYRNLGNGRFENLGPSLMVHDAGFAYGSTFVDLDNDGWLDIYALAGFHSVSRTEPDG